jgi:hypothetical protein
MSGIGRNSHSKTFLFQLATGLTLSALPAAAAPQDTSCTPTQVVEWGTRVHVRCAAAVGGISYFALSTSEPHRAARVLSLATTALVAGRTLIINFDPADLSGASFGCQTNDCRVIRAIGFGQ